MVVNLIFDLDGCVIDSTDVQKAAFFGSYYEVVGDEKCPDFSEYIKYTGDSLPNIFRKMGLPVEMVIPYRRISSSVVDKINVNDECISFIRKQKNNGAKIAICTGKDHYRVQEILKYYKIEDCFDVIVASDDVYEPKPSAMPVLKAIEIMEVEKESCVLIGDGLYDILSAKNAGIKSILSLWYGDNGISEDKSDYSVKTVKELESLIESISISDA